MKSSALFLLILVLCNTKSISQSNSTIQIDSSLEQKISIKGLCLCKLTLSDLQTSYKDLKKTNVEDMEFGKRCMGDGDSRFVNNKGYTTIQYPGIIFQKDQDDDCTKRRQPGDNR